MITLNPIGVHAPNLRCKKTSCYMINIDNKIILLDFGIGISRTVIKYVIENKIAAQDIIIIISHNHIDHVLGLNLFGKFLRTTKQSGKKVNVYISNTSAKYYNWYKSLTEKYFDVFDFFNLNESTKFSVFDNEFSFCKTDHCKNELQSFATKVSSKSGQFVYTSDIFSIDSKLSKFLESSDVVMVEAGNPVKRIRTLEGYHGNTKTNVSKLREIGVEKIYLTHLKACFDDSVYIHAISPYQKYVNILRENETFNIFTGESAKCDKILNFA